MRIILAKAAGFCMGVRRAMQTVVGEARSGPKPVRTLGPLIHNPQVIEMLRNKGVETLPRNPPDAGAGTVVIRAHGVTPDEKDHLCAGGYNVIDATCPHVIRIQKLIARFIAEDFSIVIVGDHGHAEVEGLLGYARGRGRVVESEADVAALPDVEKVCVVSQTTQSPEHFERLLGLIQKRWPECAVHRTICGSTDHRQKETVEIARQVDAMIVVGGRNSANTIRLAELAAETGTPTYHVETSDDLDVESLKRLKTVGLTAGASTPNWMIVEVAERLNEAARSTRPLPYRALAGFIRFLLGTHLYLAIGAFGAGLGCMVMDPLTETGGFPFVALLAASLYILSMYLLNIPSDQEAEKYRDPLRWRFHQKWGRSLFRVGILVMTAALALGVFQGLMAFGVLALAAAAGVVYRTYRMPDRLLPEVRQRRLVEIPGSKDLFMGLAWATVLTLLPLLSRRPDVLKDLPGNWEIWLPVGVSFLYVFTLVFIRSVVFDLREIQADQIVGRETIPVLLGKERTRILLAVLTGLLLAAMLLAMREGKLASAGYLMLLPVFYTWGYLYLYHRRAILHGIPFEIVVDGKFILIGVLALMWFWLK
jgi:4-hydroxy-3-methylbut-2-enyl diphosphate reductase